VEFLGFLDDYEDVLGHMRAADVFASPSTREGFGLTFAEAMAADCSVIAADHPDSAADEVIGDAGFLTDPTVDGIAETLAQTLTGGRPAVDPVERTAVRLEYGRLSGGDSLSTSGRRGFRPDRSGHDGWNILVTRSDSKTRSVRGELSIRSRTDLQAEQAECLGSSPEAVHRRLLDHAARGARRSQQRQPSCLAPNCLKFRSVHSLRRATRRH